MPANYQSTRSYRDCQYTFFISYSYADDIGNNRWITTLQNAIWDRLQTLPKEIGKLGNYFSQENGATVGHIADELRQNLRQSYGMLLVVGENYIESDWCEKELKLFSELYGFEGTQKRLLIAAMSETALTKAKAGPYWRQLIPSDQIWLPMYQQRSPRQPLTPKLDDGTFAKDFFSCASKIADAFINQIKEEYEVARTTSHTSYPGASNGGPWAVSATQQLKVAIGPFTDGLSEKANVLKRALDKAEVSVTLLDRRLVDNYDSDDKDPAIRDALNTFDVLIVPVDDGKPLSPSVPGGHTTILLDEWSRLKKQRGILWYRPADVSLSDADKASPKHLEKFAHLAPLCASEEAVANLLFGPNIGNAIRVYIEKHEKEPAYWRLAHALETAWEKLPGDPGRPRLKCELLDFGDLDSASKDVAAVILLLPIGLKDFGALRAQQKLVEQFFPKKGSTYPGCVALIFNPPPKSVPIHDWAALTFCKRTEEPKLVIDETSKMWLDEFLSDVWSRYQDDLHRAIDPCFEARR